MKLSKIKLHNYRCFEEEVIDIDNLTAFIGNNSTGKTAALSALKLMFSLNSKDKILKRSDFYLPKNIKPEKMIRQDMYIETVFTFEESSNAEAMLENTIPNFFDSLVIDEEGSTPYLRIRLIAEWEKSSTTEGAIESKIVYVNCSEKEDDSRDNYINVPRKDLDMIRVIYVPAIRQPEKQLKNVSGTMINQIMNCINWSENNKKEIEEKIDELNSLFMKEKGISILGDSIKEQWKEYDSDERFSNANLYFNSTNLESSIKTSNILFSPTVTNKEYNIEEIGDGLRSLFYISLVDSILDIENIIRLENNEEKPKSFSMIPPILSIILIEEPENHIAPHLLGKLISRLEKITNKSNGQMIISSHSPSIIKRINPKHIRHFRMDYSSLSTKVHSITLPDKEKYENQYKYIKESVQAYPELYFSKLVILGEGDSEEIIIPKFLNCKDIDLDKSGVSVIPLGGRHVNHFWRLLSDLEIPYITLLDLDRERDGGGWSRIKYVLKQLLLFGISKDELFSLISKKERADEILDNMNNRDVYDTKSLEKWINHLEKFNVFFSAPLDIDFLMLEHYKQYYIDILGTSEGPRICIENDGQKYYKKISDIETDVDMIDEYTSRVEEDVRSTLKKNGGDGSTYSESQRELMIWYTYFFLGRGKPSTHVLAFLNIGDDILICKMPPVMSRLVRSAKELLNKKNGDSNEADK